MDTVANNDPTQLSESRQTVCATIHRDLESGSLTVPLLPDVARQTIGLINDPDSDAGQLAKLIQSDQALAGHVMRVANSAAYSPTSSLVSLQQAIARLGMGLIGDICLSISTGAKLFKAPGYEQYLRQLWRHAVLTALWSKEISRAIRRNVESAFICGLVHSIGRPVTLQLALDQAKQLQCELPEQEVLLIVEQLQADVGKALLRRWQLPAMIVEAVVYFSNHQQAGIYSIPELSSVGLSEQQARQQYGEVLVGKALFEEIARGQIAGQQDGMLKIIADKDGKQILGMMIVGEGATELIHIGQMAMINDNPVDVFVESIFNFPTLAEAYRVAALAIIGQRRSQLK